MLTFIFILCAAAALLGSWVLRAVVARYEPVRSAGSGVVSVELRRRTLLQEHPSGLGGEPFRQPVERRVRVFRVAGFPLWCQMHGVDLPMQVSGMLGTLTARDFDSEFDTRFRLAGFSRVLPAWAARGAGRDGGDGKGGSRRPAGQRVPR